MIKSTKTESHSSKKCKRITSMNVKNFGGEGRTECINLDLKILRDLDWLIEFI